MSSSNVFLLNAKLFMSSLEVTSFSQWGTRKATKCWMRNCSTNLLVVGHKNMNLNILATLQTTFQTWIRYITAFFCILNGFHNSAIFALVFQKKKIWIKRTVRNFNNCYACYLHIIYLPTYFFCLIIMYDVHGDQEKLSV